MSTLPASFSVTGWLTVDPTDSAGERDIYSCFDRSNRRGVTLREIAGGGGYCGQGDSVRLSFGMDDATTPSWRAAPVVGSGWQSREDLAAERNGDGAVAPSGATLVDGNDDDAMRLWGRATSVAEHDGHMFASTGNATSTADDGIDGTNLGSVYAMSAGTVATTARSVRRGRRHIAAVRDGAELRLYVDGELAAAASGDIDGPLLVPAEAGQDLGLEHHQWHDHALGPADVSALAVS